jgi:DNA-binding protein H-NS
VHVVAATGTKAVVAWCDACKLPFAAGRYGEGGMAIGFPGQTTHINHVTIGPGQVNLQGGLASCPACGAMGVIQEGAYDTVAGVVRETVKAFDNFTLVEAATLIEALRQRQDDKVDDATVINATPAKAKKWVQKVLKKGDKKFWIGILLSVLLFLYNAQLNASSTQSIELSVQRTGQETKQEIQHLEKQNENLRHLIEEVIKDESERTSQLKIAKIPPQRARPPDAKLAPPPTMPSRNAFCWCGSGRKFKRCHKRSS